MGDVVSNPRVSVIVAAFNAASTLPRAVESCLSQTLCSIEVLVVDDGSIDDTATVMEKLCSGDERVRYLRMPQNGGVARARNHGIDRARGEWVAILDADDHLHSERLSRLLSLASECKADLIADNFYHYDTASEEIIRTAISENRLPSGRVIGLEDFIENCMPRGSNRFSGNFGLLKPLIRRGFLEEKELRYSPGMALAEDYALYVSCVIEGAKFFITPEPYYYYHFNEQSASKSPKVEDLRRIVKADDAFLAHSFLAGRGRARRLLNAHKQATEKKIAFHELQQLFRRRSIGNIPFFVLRRPFALPYIAKRVFGHLLSRA